MCYSRLSFLFLFLFFLLFLFFAFFFGLYACDGFCHIGTRRVFVCMPLLFGLAAFLFSGLAALKGSGD